MKIVILSLILLMLLSGCVSKSNINYTEFVCANMEDGYVEDSYCVISNEGYIEYDYICLDEDDYVKFRIYSDLNLEEVKYYVNSGWGSSCFFE